jgi:hypothetical protein
VELEKALRIVEARRGELLDIDVVPGGRANLSMRGKVEGDQINSPRVGNY